MIDTFNIWKVCCRNFFGVITVFIWCLCLKKKTMCGFCEYLSFQIPCLDLFLRFLFIFDPPHAHQQNKEDAPTAAGLLDDTIPPSLLVCTNIFVNFPRNNLFLSSARRNLPSPIIDSKRGKKQEHYLFRNQSSAHWHDVFTPPTSSYATHEKTHMHTHKHSVSHGCWEDWLQKARRHLLHWNMQVNSDHAGADTHGRTSTRSVPPVLHINFKMPFDIV